MTEQHVDLNKRIAVVALIANEIFKRGYVLTSAEELAEATCIIIETGTNVTTSEYGVDRIVEDVAVCNAVILNLIERDILSIVERRVNLELLDLKDWGFSYAASLAYFFGSPYLSKCVDGLRDRMLCECGTEPLWKESFSLGVLYKYSTESVDIAVKYAQASLQLSNQQSGISQLYTIDKTPEGKYIVVRFNVNNEKQETNTPAKGN